MGMQVGDEGTESLVLLQNLDTLSLSFTEVRPADVADLLMRLPKLRRYLLDGIPISLLGIRHLFKLRPGLLMWKQRVSNPTSPSPPPPPPPSAFLLLPLAAAKSGLDARMLTHRSPASSVDHPRMG